MPKTELDHELTRVRDQRNTVEEENRKLRAIADHLKAIDNFESDSKKLKAEIRAKLPNAPAEPDQVLAEVKTNRNKVEAENIKLKAVVDHLKVIANCDTDNKKLRVEIDRLEKIHLPKS